MAALTQNAKSGALQAQRLQGSNAVTSTLSSIYGNCTCGPKMASVSLNVYPKAVTSTLKSLSAKLIDALVQYSGYGGCGVLFSLTKLAAHVAARASSLPASDGKFRAQECHVPSRILAAMESMLGRSTQDPTETHAHTNLQGSRHLEDSLREFQCAQCSPPYCDRFRPASSLCEIKTQSSTAQRSNREHIS